MTTGRGLHAGFLDSSERFAERTALEVGGAKYTYADLRSRAAAIAATLQRHLPASEYPLTALFAYRTVSAFAGVLGALFRGHGYVPLNPNFPADRTRSMLERSFCTGVIVDKTGAAQLEKVLEGIEKPTFFCMPATDDVSALRTRWPKHKFVGATELEPASAWVPPSTSIGPKSVAYVLFTSGSTGVPKGCVVSHDNANAFVAYAAEHCKVTEHDRVSQMFELVFDVSISDMFVTWSRGACLCVPQKDQMLTPGKYINESKLTIWYSVPSVALLMKRLRLLAPGAYPTLRLSMFAGEALLADTAMAWAAAAPSSIVENHYGPTELTVTVTGYRWEGEKSLAESENGVVPIGRPYPSMDVLVADENYRAVGEGESGELLMAGPQCSLGYWNDAEKTAAAFVTPPGKHAIYYRTGDLVRARADGMISYLGRIDNQIKIHGLRVELGEIEAVLREVSGADIAVALGWPVTASGADGIVAFVGNSEVSIADIKERAKARLPAYMIPRELRRTQEFPLNSNGKVDRKALLKILNEP